MGLEHDLDEIDENELLDGIDQLKLTNSSSQLSFKKTKSNNIYQKHNLEEQKEPDTTFTKTFSGKDSYCPPALFAPKDA